MQSCHAGLELESLAVHDLGTSVWGTLVGVCNKKVHCLKAPTGLMVQVCFQKHGSEPSNLAKSWPKPIPHASPPKGRTHTCFFLQIYLYKWTSPPPNSPCPSKPLGEEMELIYTYLPSPNENVFAIPCIHWNPRYEFGWDELHLAKGATGDTGGPPPDAAVTGCLNPHVLRRCFITCECQQQLLCCDLTSGNVKPLTVLQCDV